MSELSPEVCLNRAAKRVRLYLREWLSMHIADTGCREVSHAMCADSRSVRSVPMSSDFSPSPSASLSTTSPDDRRAWMMTIGVIRRSLCVEGSEYFVHPQSSEILFDALATGETYAEICRVTGRTPSQMRVILDEATLQFLAAVTLRGFQLMSEIRETRESHYVTHFACAASSVGQPCALAS